VIATRVIQTATPPIAETRPRETAAKEEQRQEVATSFEEAVAIPEGPRPIYLTDIREWVAAPIREGNSDTPREPEVIRSRSRVRETAERKETAETHSENFTLSIGSIHVTVEDSARQVVPPAPPRPAAVTAPENRFDATRLSRSYVTF